MNFRTARPALALWCLLLAALIGVGGNGCSGCRESQTSRARGDILVDTEGVTFAAVYVGHHSEAFVAVQNQARYSHDDVAVTFEGPFGLVQPLTSLAAAESRRLELTFAPSAVGEIEGRMILRYADQTATVPLRGEGKRPLDCASPSPCKSSTFQPATGECLETVLADGLSCGEGSQCLLEGKCAAGECVGRSLDCDDKNACTADACDPSQGCVHYDSSARCASSANPCEAPLCDPEKGCAYAPVEDGIKCGPSDCEIANVCLLGQCQQVPLSDGAVCGEDTPCQAKGICQNNQCVREPQHTMQPLWDVQAKPGAYLYFDSIADVQANIYWRECSGSQVDIVSVTRDGTPRYRIPTQALCTLEGMVMLDGTLVLKTQNGAEAYQAFGGAKLWERDLLADLKPSFPEIPDATATVVIQHLSRSVPGKLVVAAEGSSLNTSGTRTFHGTWLISLDLFTGAFDWMVALPRLHVREMLVDEMSNLYLGTVVFVAGDGLPVNSREFFAFTAKGVQRWRQPNGFDHPAAVYGGRIYHWNQSLSDTATGAQVGMVTQGETVGYPRMTLGAGYYVTGETIKVPSCLNPEFLMETRRLALTKYDPATAQGGWSYEISGFTYGGEIITNTLLTWNNSILFSQNEGLCPPASESFMLREISSSGEERFRCPLPGPERYSYFGLLEDELWAASYYHQGTDTRGVRAFRVPGLGLAKKGWTAALGSMSRDHRPR